MGPSILKKRKFDDRGSTKPAKKVRKQKHYSSSSSSSASEDELDDFLPNDLSECKEGNDSASDDPESGISARSARKTGLNAQSNSASSDSVSASDSENSLTSSNITSTTRPKKMSKRNDPTAFASSISAILSSKLTSQKRSDPVLSRSATAQEANTSIANAKLEAKAKKKMKQDRREALEKGRVRDVLLGTDRPVASTGGGDSSEPAGEGEMSVGELQEHERRLRKTAQRGVVKLFNAVRAAQVKAEEARAKGGTRGRKEERVGEMSKKGFLEMVAAGGTGGAKMNGEGIEEA